MELTLLQVAVVGALASVITRGLQLVANRYGWKPNREQVNIGLFVVSLGLGASFFDLPEITGVDPLEVAGELVAAAGYVVGVAALSYNIFLSKVLLPAKTG